VLLLGLVLLGLVLLGWCCWRGRVHPTGPGRARSIPATRQGL
jgi:hypothetical protein